MIARGSTRLTVPVMSSPSRLGELVVDDVALGLAEALEDDLLGRLGADPAEASAIELLGRRRGRPGSAFGLVASWPRRCVNSVSGILDLGDRGARPEDADLAGLGVDPDVDVLVAFGSAGRPTGWRPRPCG